MCLLTFPYRAPSTFVSKVLGVGLEGPEMVKKRDLCTWNPRVWRLDIQNSSNKASALEQQRDWTARVGPRTRTPSIRTAPNASVDTAMVALVLHVLPAQRSCGETGALVAGVEHGDGLHGRTVKPHLVWLCQVTGSPPFRRNSSI